VKSVPRGCGALFIVLVLFASSFAADPRTELKPANEAAKQWLWFEDEGRYGEAWDNAATFLQQKISKSAWEKTMTSTRAPFGRMLSRDFKSADYTTKPTGAPAGNYFVIEYRTNFALAPKVIETVAVMLEKNGQWHVAGYYLRPADN